MPDIDIQGLLQNDTNRWTDLLVGLCSQDRAFGLTKRERHKLEDLKSPDLNVGSTGVMTQQEIMDYGRSSALFPKCLPLRYVTPYEQLRYLDAVCSLRSLEGSCGQALRIRFARRVSQARERRRELAVRLLRENPIDPVYFLDLVVGLVARPFAVPPLLLENPPALRQRIDATAFPDVVDNCPQPPYKDDLIKDLCSILNDPDVEDLTVRVEQALNRIFGPENRRLPQAVDACTWIKAAAEMAGTGTRVRTVRAMYAPNTGLGQSIDLVIALCPPGERRDLDPRGLDTVLRGAYAAVTKTLDRQEDWTIRAWLHDFPGGSTDDGPPIGEIRSAGVASAIAIASALTGRPIRDDIVSTGTVDENGCIGSVAATISSKVGGLFGWLKPALDTNPNDRPTFTVGFVPGADLKAAEAAAGQASDRIRPLATVKDHVLTLDQQGPLDLPRFEQYRKHPFLTRKQSAADDDVAGTIDTLLGRFMESYQPKSLTTALLPWWLPKCSGSRTDFKSEKRGLHLMRAEWIGDGLLTRLIDQLNHGQRESIPVFLNNRDDSQSVLQTHNRQWLPETVRRIVTAAGDDADLYTITSMLSEGHFTLIVDADRLDSNTMSDVLEQATVRFSQCRWIFLSHVTRCGEKLYARHGALLDNAFQHVDLMEDGQNSSVWDSYLQRTAKELVQLRAGGGALQTDPAWLEAYFGDDTCLGRPIPRYLPRKLGPPQESTGHDYQAGPRKTPATLDKSPQGLFSRERVYPLEIIEARSGRGKSLIGLHKMFVWLRGGTSSIGTFGVIPLFLDVNQYTSHTKTIHDALNAHQAQFEAAIGAALEAVLRGEHLDERDPKRAKARLEFEAILDALGTPDRTACLALLLNGLGPTAIMIDGLREVPDSKLKAERIVPNLIRLADIGPVPGQPAGVDPTNQHPLTRVVLFWRSDVVKTDFSRKFDEQLREVEQQHRISELLPFDQNELLTGYLEPAFENKPQVLEDLKNEPGLLSTLASNLRVLDAVTRLEEQVVNELKKEVVERGWDSDKKEPVDRSFERITGGRILRWALIKDFGEGLAADNSARQSDKLLRALPETRRQDRENELIALGLLGFLATSKGQGVGQLTLEEVGPVLDRVFALPHNGCYRLWQGSTLTDCDADPAAAHDACAHELERITKRVWVKGDYRYPDQWRLDFRHEEDRVLATVWLLDRVLQKHPAFALTLRDTDGAGAEPTLQGLDLVRYAFALENGLSRDEVNERRAEWSAVHLLFAEASEQPELLFDQPEVRRILDIP